MNHTNLQPNHEELREEWEENFSNWMKSHDNVFGGIDSRMIPYLIKFIKGKLSEQEARHQAELEALAELTCRDCGKLIQSKYEQTRNI